MFLESDRSWPEPNLSSLTYPQNEAIKFIDYRTAIKVLGCEEHEAALPSGEKVSLIGVTDAILGGPVEPLLFINTHRGPLCIRDSALLLQATQHSLPNHGHAVVSAFPAGELRIIDRPALFLAGPGSQAPYHWLHDALPRLLVMREAHPEASIIVPAPTALNGFIAESLALLKVPDNKIEHLPPGEWVCARKAWVVEDLFAAPSKHTELLRQLRRELVEAVGCNPSRVLDPADGRRIYLSRQAAPEKRGIENHQDLVAAIEPWGFAEQRMESLPLRDQIRLAVETTTIIAPHGAGLFHTLFITGGAVLELYPVDEVGEATNAPWWNRILAAHESDGRDVRWRAVDSRIVRKGPAHMNLFSIIADIPQIQRFVRGNHPLQPNMWERVRLKT